MLRQDPDSIGTKRNTPPAGGQPYPSEPAGNAARTGGVDIQEEFNKLEEMVLDSPRVWLSRWTMVDEEQILQQLDLLRLHLPSAFREATEVLRNKDEILAEAEEYAQEIIRAAEQRAGEILNEMGLIRQAEMEANQIRLQVQEECQMLQEQTLSEIEMLRRQTQQDVEEMRMMAIAECEEIQRGADDYADRVLRDMEQQLADMMRVIRNGRQQLQLDSPSRN
jgi:F0F1-type ATP synthase membrane subunit b/b'